MKTQPFPTRVPGLTFLLLTALASQAQNGVHATATVPPMAPQLKSPMPADSAAKPDAPKPSTRLSPWVSEVVRLTQAGIEENVVLSFIENSGTFSLGADQIIHLANAGVSTPVITAMLQHDADLASGAKPLTVYSRPKLGPELEKLLARFREADEKAAASAPRPPPVVPPVPAEPAGFQNSEPAQEMKSAVRTDEPKSAPTSLTPASELAKTTAASPQAPMTRHPPSPYRVRETRAVEFLPPILVINAAVPTPNLVVIDMFPSSR